MNEYKIEVKKVIKNVLTIAGKSEEEALQFMEGTFLRTDLLESSNGELETVEVKIIGRKRKNVE